MMASMSLSSGAGTPAKLTATLWFGWKERLVLEHSCLVTSGSGRRGGRCGGRRPWGSCCSGTGPAFHVHGFLVVVAVGIACAGDGRCDAAGDAGVPEAEVAAYRDEPLDVSLENYCICTRFL